MYFFVAVSNTDAGVVVLDHGDEVLAIGGEGTALGLEVMGDVVAVGAEKTHAVETELGGVLPQTG